VIDPTLIIASLVAWVLLIPFMASLSRMSGGGAPKLPLGLDQWIFALPFLILLLDAGCGWLAIPGYICAVAGKRTANAPFLDLGTSTAWRATSLTKFLGWLRGRVPEWQYDAAGLALGGLAVVLGPALLIGLHGQIWAAVGLLASGGCKALAYVIGWRWSARLRARLDPDLQEPTGLAEYLTGAFHGIGVLLAWLLISA